MRLEVRPNTTTRLGWCPVCSSGVESAGHGALEIYPVDGEDFLCSRCANIAAPDLLAQARADDAGETETLLAATIAEAQTFAESLDEQGRDEEAAAVRAEIVKRQAKLRWISEQRLTDPSRWREGA